MSGLPFTRNFDFDGASPVDSGTLNDLQDWCIRHHAILEGQKAYFFGASAFRPLSTAAQIAAGQVPTCDGFVWEFSACPNSAACPAMSTSLMLPPDWRVTVASFFQTNTVNAVFDSALEIRSKVFPAGAVTVLTSGASTGPTDPDMKQFPTGVISHDTVALEAIELRWFQTVNTHNFGGCIVVMGPKP